jgi:flagellar motor switch protein FliG
MQAMIEPVELKKFSGLQRAAALMLALGKDNGATIWQQLGIEEVKELSTTMAQLGRVPAPVVEHLLLMFSSEVSTISSLHGSFETTERLLEGILPDDKLKEVMEDIRGPSGRTMWDKLSNVSENVLAAFLKNEYPQTVAVILSKLRSEHCARVLAALPRDFAIDVIQRMLRMEQVQKDIVNEIENTLKNEFMTNLSRAQKHDPHEAMAEVFNAFDRTTEESVLGALDACAPESAERIRALMFTFDDLAGLLPAAIATLVKNADKRQMALALKGAPEEMRQIFLAAMTERAAKMLREDMASMGPVRARECEEAQTGLVRLAKLLADRGEIVLVDPKADETMII